MGVTFLVRSMDTLHYRCGVRPHACQSRGRLGLVPGLEGFRLARRRWEALDDAAAALPRLVEPGERVLARLQNGAERQTRGERTRVAPLVTDPVRGAPRGEDRQDEIVSLGEPLRDVRKHGVGARGLP